MDRKVSDRTLLDEFAEDFAGVVERFCKYIIVSGFVAIAHGRTRGTEDIDMIIEHISRDKFVKLHDSLVVEGFECHQSAQGGVVYDNYLARGTSVRYVRKGNFIPEMELKLAKDELDNYQILTRKKMLLTGLDVWFSSVEMNIAFKEEYLKSEKDMEDARYLRIVYKDEISEKEINKIKGDIRRIRFE